MASDVVKRRMLYSSGRQGRLDLLPNEILHLISNFAHPADRTSLALTNHRLCNALGTQHLRQLQSQPDTHRNATARFLVTLRRDFSGYTACLQCLKLHRQVDVRDQHAPCPLQALTFCDKLDGVTVSALTTCSYRRSSRPRLI